MELVDELNQMTEDYFNELTKINQHIKLINSFDVEDNLLDLLGEVKGKEIIL